MGLNSSKTNDYVTGAFVHFGDKEILIDSNCMQNLEKLKKNDRNYPVHIISNVGSGRISKSSLTNAFLSWIYKKDMKIFEVGSTIEHCTRGINYFFTTNPVTVNGKTMYLLVLDCQGITHHDSKNDARVLLLPYILSNVIVHHDNLINNNTIKSLEPILTFANFIDVKAMTKPTLCFRMKDYNLETDPTVAMKKCLELHGDHYDEVRKAVRNLFAGTAIISTNPLDKSLLTRMKKREYRKIISTESTGFKRSFEQLGTLLQKTECSNMLSIPTFVTTVIEHLNKNKKIDLSHLDNYTLVHENMLYEYVMQISTRLFQRLAVTHTNESYMRYIERHAWMEREIAELHGKFSRVNKGIRVKFADGIRQRVTPILEDARIKIETDVIDLVGSKMQPAFDHCKRMLTTVVDGIIPSCLDKKILGKIKNFFEEYRDFAFDILSEYDIPKVYVEHLKQTFEKNKLEDIINYIANKKKKATNEIKKIEIYAKYMTKEWVSENIIKTGMMDPDRTFEENIMESGLELYAVRANKLLDGIEDIDDISLDIEELKVNNWKDFCQQVGNPRFKVSMNIICDEPRDYIFSVHEKLAHNVLRKSLESDKLKQYYNVKMKEVIRDLISENKFSTSWIIRNPTVNFVIFHMDDMSHRNNSLLKEILVEKANLVNIGEYLYALSDDFKEFVAKVSQTQEGFEKFIGKCKINTNKNRTTIDLIRRKYDKAHLGCNKKLAFDAMVIFCAQGES